ncbi:MAG: Rieske (2Fe-2S) protein [Porticoccaceae bacterium]|jgi:nitrite reductase/ring-hydroxylating ferredoxin subunit
MSDMIKVVALDDFEVNTLRKVEHDDGTIVVISLDSGFYAMDGKCGHAGGPLCRGEIDAVEKTIACPWHGWEYSITSGECIFDPSLAQKTYPVEVRDGDVFVRVG